MITTTRIVRDGYNAMAQAYDNNRRYLAGSKYVQKLLDKLKVNSEILDLGCGSGNQVDELLIRKGHLVTGLDVSKVQIAMARQKYPAGNFLEKDILDLRPYEYRVEAVVSFYTLFHIPRSEHQAMLETWSTYLAKGGWLLVTMGDKDFEGLHEMYGEQIWSSHYNPKTNRQMIEKAGFNIEIDEIDNSGGERHQIVMARKK